MNQDNVAKIVSVLNSAFYQNKPSLEEVESYEPILQKMFKSFSKDEISEGIRNYKISMGVKINLAEVLTKHQEDKWFDQLNPNDFSHYKRFKDYLKNGCGRSNEKIDAIQKDNFTTIRNFADPTTTDTVQRKGLVVGDVQAGKTENYIGLMNLAVDVGYKNIILLTGTTEELRKQTQRRVDEGLVGAHSESLLNEKDKFEYCGVGDGGSQCFAVSLTTYDNDFSIAASRKMAFKLSNFNLPTVFVIKKNSSVIRQVINMVNKDDDELNKDSVLIIDDECDYASLNTKKEEEDPTAINKGIRDLMSLYAKSTYVGYSATPFANIFVNPDANYGENEDMIPDLFPSDFIVLLESPNNYIGAKDMFYGFDDSLSDDGSIKQIGNSTSFIHLIGDHYDNYGNYIVDKNFLPAKHKKDVQYIELADSLKKAIKVYLLSSCVYSLRGFEKQHRTMLINISRFNNVQEEIGYQVKSYVKRLKDAIDGSVRMSDEYFNRQPIISDLEDLWENDIAFRRGTQNRKYPPNREYTFSEIKSAIKYEIDNMQVFITNTTHKKDRLKYDDYKGTGVRGIVVGGFTLSRGLTLSGLMTSYYSRNAMAYDTLVQMGRWFGYRDNYDDLVNVYMSQSSIDAFCAASDATEDLKVQFRRMAEEHKKPIDFGLMVREAPTTIENIPLVTSRNKMRNTKDYIRTIELTGKSIDTSKIFKSRDLNHKNAVEVNDFLKKISIFLKQPTKPDEKRYFENVPKELICDFLDNIHVSGANKTFDCHILSEFIRNSRKLDNWIVTIGKGRDSKQVLSDGFELMPRPNGLQGQMEGPCVQRSFELSPAFDDEEYFRVGGSKNTIVDPGVFTIGLTKEQIERAKARYAQDKPGSKMNPGSRYWLYECTCPILVIYPIDLKPTDKSEPDKKEVRSSKKEKIIEDVTGNDILYGFALGFPGKTTQILRVKYKINLVYQKNLEEKNQDYDEDDWSDYDLSN